MRKAEDPQSAENDDEEEIHRQVGNRKADNILYQSMVDHPEYGGQRNAGKDVWQVQGAEHG